MPQYLFVYHGGHTPTEPAEVEATMAAWGGAGSRIWVKRWTRTPPSEDESLYEA